MRGARYGRKPTWIAKVLEVAEEEADPDGMLAKASGPTPAAEKVDKLARKRLGAGREEKIEKARVAVYRSRPDLAERVRKEHADRRGELLRAKREARESLRKIAGGEASSWASWILNKAREGASGSGRPRPEDIVEAVRQLFGEFPGMAEHVRAEQLEF